MKPIVSVVVPVFNSERWLARALQSLVDQTLDPRLLEVVVVDDCSSDRSVEIAGEFTEKRNSIHVLGLEQFSRGPGRARNAGVRKATGTWVAFLDADDAYLPEGLEAMLDLAQESRCDVAACRLEVVSETERATPAIYDQVLPDPLSGVAASEHPELLLAPLSVCGRLFRRSFLLDCDIWSPEGVIAQDSVFTTEALLRAAAVSYRPVSVYEYQRNDSETSISDTLDERYFSDWLATRSMIEALYAEHSSLSYLDTRYDIDLKHGVAQLLRYSRRVDFADNADRRSFVETVRAFQPYCARYSRADLENPAPLLSLVPMLIGDGDVDLAMDIIRLWNQAIAGRPAGVA